MRRHKKRRKGEDVTLKMAAMLDMAFQLLTFFILTFKPAPIEWEVLLRMPPPESMVVRQGKAPGSDTKSTDPLRGLDTLAIEVIANRNGGISSIQVEGSAMGNNMSLLTDKLQGIIGNPDAKFTQVLISVDPQLKYEGLMRIVGVCTSIKLPDGTRLGKLGFISMGGE